MNTDQRSDLDPAASARKDLNSAMFIALVITLVALVFIKAATGIVWFSAILVAVLLFTLSLACVLRVRRGIRQ
jgi:Flp pilus assembly protein TadB